MAIKTAIIIIILTSVIYPQTEQDTTQSVQTSDTVFEITKSPWGAVLRSAVIPGWGQFYNESYWKIPVIWGLLGYYISVWIDQNQLYDKYKELYSNSIESGITISLYKRNRDFYKDQRDRFAVYIGLAYFLTMVDAYVDAHLFDFDVSVDLLIGQPQLKIKFPIR